MSSDRPTIITQLGHAGWHDHEVRGVVVFEIDPACTSTVDLLLLTLGVPTDVGEARKVVELCVQAGLNPDPRIPPMKLVRLGAAHGGLLSGLATGFIGLHDSYAGMSALADAARFLQAIQAALGWDFDDDALDGLLRERRRSRDGIFGFGVAGRPIDERVPWFASHLAELPHGERRWWHLFERIAKLLGKYRRQPNFGGAAAAALLDLGCTAEQICAIACLMGFIPLVGNAHEGSIQAPEELRVLPTTSVAYKGAPPRRSPRAAGEEP